MKTHAGHGRDGSGPAASGASAGMAPGKRTLVEAVDHASASPGHALPAPVQHKLEGAYGADLSGVRVHTGAASQAAAASLGAQAYTTGQDIHFGAGKYDPSSKAGEHLLAHEVVHTVQQRGAASAAPQEKLEISEPGDAAEHEADTLATAAVEGKAGASVTQRPQTLARAIIQREPDASVGTPTPTPAPTTTTAAPAGPAAPVVRGGIDLTAIGQDQGIRVAVGYYSSAADVAANTTSYQAHPLKEVLAWGNVKPAGDQPLIKAVLAQITAGTSKPDDNTTATDADMIARAVQANNTEFGRRAVIHAAQRKTISGAAGALSVGTHMAFDETSGKPIEAIQAVSTAIGSLAPAAPAAGATPSPTPTPTATPTPAAPVANIAEVAFFTHGVSTNIGLGKDGWMNGGSVAGKLGPLATPNVQILVYGCNAAGGKDSFAETLATTLAKAGHTARVFGHTSAGPATVNADGREFNATPDGAGGAKVTSATDYDLVFSNDFQNAEMPPIAADLGIDLTKGSPHDGWTSNQYAVFGGIGKVSKAWLAKGMSKVVAAGGIPGANSDGTKSTEEAAYTIGTAKDPTVDAVRKEWQAYRSSAPGKAELTKQIPAKSITK